MVLSPCFGVPGQYRIGRRTGRSQRTVTEFRADRAVVGLRAVAVPMGAPCRCFRSRPGRRGAGDSRRSTDRRARPVNSAPDHGSRRRAGKSDSSPVAGRPARVSP